MGPTITYKWPPPAPIATIYTSTPNTPVQGTEAKREGGRVSGPIGRTLQCKIRWPLETCMRKVWPTTEVGLLTVPV